MASNKRYLIDSDVLIGAKNLYYRPAFCGAFWDWLEIGHNSGRLFSIDKVKKELLNGKEEDVLYHWAQRPQLKNFFLSTTSSASKWADLSKWATGGNFLPAAQAKFLNAESADAWLIAYAAFEGDCVVVTNEVSDLGSRRSIKLPDAATVLNVQTMSLFELLQGHARNTFEYHSVA